jgi:hypothetical protein
MSPIWRNDSRDSEAHTHLPRLWCWFVGAMRWGMVFANPQQDFSHRLARMVAGMRAKQSETSPFCMAGVVPDCFAPTIRCMKIYKLLVIAAAGVSPRRLDWHGETPARAYYLFIL